MTEPPLFGPSVGSGPSPQGDPAPVVPPPPGPEATPFGPSTGSSAAGWTSYAPLPGQAGPPPGPAPTDGPGWAAPPAYGGPPPTAGPPARRSPSAGLVVILIAIAIACVGAIAAFAVIGSGGSKASPAPGGSAAATAVGVLVYTDDFHDPASGWSTDTLPSGTTYTYGSKGFVVHAVGALHHLSAVPHGRERQRVVVSTTATQSSPAPDAAGFGVSCDRGTDTDEIRYEFIAFADGTWTIERLYGALSTTGDAPEVIKEGTLPTKPGAVPMTVAGTCVTHADGLTTDLAIDINGVNVGQLSDTPRALPGAGWYAELVVVSDDPPTDVTVTKFEVRTLP